MLVDDDSGASLSNIGARSSGTRRPSRPRREEEATRRAYATLLRGSSRADCRGPGTSSPDQRRDARHGGRAIDHGVQSRSSSRLRGRPRGIVLPSGGQVGHAGDDLVHLLVGKRSRHRRPRRRCRPPIPNGSVIRRSSRGERLVLEDAELLLVGGTASVVGRSRFTSAISMDNWRRRCGTSGSSSSADGAAAGRASSATGSSISRRPPPSRRRWWRPRSRPRPRLDAADRDPRTGALPLRAHGRDRMRGVGGESVGYGGTS